MSENNRLFFDRINVIWCLKYFFFKFLKYFPYNFNLFVRIYLISDAVHRLMVDTKHNPISIVYVILANRY